MTNVKVPRFFYLLYSLIIMGLAGSVPSLLYASDSVVNPVKLKNGLNQIQPVVTKPPKIPKIPKK